MQFITTFVTNFVQKYITQFGDSLNLSPNLVTNLVTNLSQKTLGLLPPMEYNRDDDITKTNLVTVATMNVEEEEENMPVETQWETTMRHWFPQLKAIG